MSLKRWFDHQLDVGLYPLTLISVFLCMVHPQAYWVVWIIGCIYWIYRKMSLMMLCWTLIGLWFRPQDVLVETTQLNNDPVTVVSIHTSSVLVNSEYGYYYVISDDFYPIGTRLLIHGELTPSNQSSSFYGFDSSTYNRKKGIVGSVFDPTIMTNGSTMSIEGSIQTKLIEWLGEEKGRALIDVLWFNQTQDTLWLFASSYVYITLIHGLIRLLSFGLTKKYCDRIQMILTITCGLCFGFSFVLIRQLLRLALSFIQMDRIHRFSITILLWLVICNGYTTSIGFLFPFLYYWLSLMGKLDRRKSMLVSLFIQGITLHQINLLSILSFKITRIITAMVFVMDIFNICSGNGIDHSCLNRFNDSLTLYGSPLGYGLIIYLAIYGLFQRMKYHPMLMVCIYLLFTYQGWFQPTVSMYCINVGQGDATLIKDKFNQTVILVDTGKASAYDDLTTALYGYGITHIDALFITHDDADHSDNKEAIIQDFDVDQCIDTPFDTVMINTIPVTNLNPGGYDNANDNSLVLLFEVNGQTILLPGDISASVEADIFTDLDINVDIFKASHHGSSTGNSELLIHTIKPHYIIYSAGSPAYYGHPAQSVRQIAQSNKIVQLNTYTDGDIQFHFFHGLTMVWTSSGQYDVYLS